MSKHQSEPKRKRGRPVKYTMPEKINAAYEAEAETWEAQAEMFVRVAAGFVLLDAWETASRQWEMNQKRLRYTDLIAN